MSDLVLLFAQEQKAPDERAETAWPYNGRYERPESVKAVLRATDYGDDPFKAMVRKYDRAVVRNGGASIFTIRAYTVIF